MGVPHSSNGQPFVSFCLRCRGDEGKVKVRLAAGGRLGGRRRTAVYGSGYEPGNGHLAASQMRRLVQMWPDVGVRTPDRMNNAKRLVYGIVCLLAE